MVSIRRPAGTALLVVAGAYSWWAAGLPAFSVVAHVAVFGAAIAVLVLGTRFERHSTERHPRIAAASLLPWAALVIAVVGFELFNFFQHPRGDHPTMSSLINEVDVLPVRRVMYLAWLALGWHLVGKTRGRSPWPEWGWR